MKVLIFLFIIVILFVLDYKFFKYFTKMYIENFSTYVPNIDNKLKKEIVSIMSSIINSINKNFNMELVLGNIDRVEKTQEENGVNYDINVFIYNKHKYINKKINFNINVNNGKIIINSVKNGSSRNILVEERAGFASRGSLIYKPSVDLDNVEKNNNIKLEFSNIYFPNKLKNGVNRNEYILPDDYIENRSLVFPKRIIGNMWDIFGIKDVQKKKYNSTINHSVTERNIVPNFYINNFNTCNSQYDFLFNLAEDSASRPIGITGSRG